jgi:GNAT superfamily N-acetyltransferase
MDLVEVKTSAAFQRARELFLEYAAWLGVDLCFQGFAEELERLPEIYGPPSGGLLLAEEEGGVAVGCVGLRKLSVGECEMKRLFVREGARGRGVGKALALGVVEAARGLGYQRMVLDTLDQMSAARHIYAALGFREIEGYYSNPLSGVRYMALDLQPPAAR